MKLIDTHAHYFDEKFSALPGGAAALLETLFASDVAAIVNCATTTATSLEVLDLAQRFDGCFAAVGIHPENCGEEDCLDAALSRLRDLVRRPKVVAIGEIGLDYYWQENPPRDVQRTFFEAQLDLARETRLPVVIHDRDAHGDTFDLLAQYPDVLAILHSYSGSPEMARQYLRNPNRYISFSGVLTFKNAVQTVETAKIVPLDRMLVETDCPYLAPVPHRGQINHSGYLPHIVDRLAQIKNLPPDVLANTLNDNAKRAFKF